MHGEGYDPRRTFSRSAQRYLDSGDHRSGPDLEVVRELAAAMKPAVTADLATGAGHALRAAAPFSVLSAGLDLTHRMLQVARRHLEADGLKGVRFIQARADRIPLADASVSLLTCRIAPHHFPSIPAFLEEVTRVLGAGGRAVIIDSVVPPEKALDDFLNGVERVRDPSHVRSHTLGQWHRFIEGAGLHIVSTRLFSRRHPFREWARRTGLEEEGVRILESAFREASAAIRGKFRVELGPGGEVISYTDEKAIFVMETEKTGKRDPGP